ncbi:MAG TPA: DUF1819 family protein [Phycisphaerae bacterium]|jgi:hypothetical protein|nr:DUF1819 family protein [Phycisphaerae bacterium]
MKHRQYTTQLQAGLGMVDETRTLLDLWTPGMTAARLNQVALESGRFPGVSARRLRNLVTECFHPRLLVDGGRPAEYLKTLRKAMSLREFEQMLLVYTCRANIILADFIRDVYWPAYSSGRDALSNLEAREFVTRANQQGLTARPWSDTTIRRVSAYLTGACADFGLLERGNRSVRKVLPCRIEPHTAIVLAYDLHFSGLGDNAVIGHPDWTLFGLDRADVISELKRLSLKGTFLVQMAGEVVRIGWQCKNAKELSSAIAEG